MPPFVGRVHADPGHPGLLRDDNQAIFTISALSFFSEGHEIAQEKDKQIAFYLMLHSDWQAGTAVATMNVQRIKYVEIEASQANDKHSSQEFEALGILAGTISGYYKWLTAANDEIVRLASLRVWGSQHILTVPKLVVANRPSSAMCVLRRRRRG
ncbi:hypothetical protein [Paraburkholderia dilworthii]|uniref:hypothetical protein n=1 Tax=Paraburkholderia dilworthii TaxID=948106 RepID=UPI000489B1ED|nr:hypothetical protein [Paraburkholderia dilworthii]